MIKTLLKIDRIKGDLRAVSGGPVALAKRLGRRESHRLPTQGAGVRGLSMARRLLTLKLLRDGEEIVLTASP